MGESDDEEDQEIEEENEENEEETSLDNESISNAEPSPRELELELDTVNESTFINDEIHEANDFISFKRGDTENMGDDGRGLGLQYIDSFLRGISTNQNVTETHQLQEPE